ncbi:hypothetical protein H2201_007322 [Coniosporium apollinis]|uniref:Ankyrin n=2 Tax=Coniosporium TaxID=2810619 RepID=A0ABQ9NJP4_9PEZI|nr:hypothetical protein H2199_006132 [Cladosporium sp. JES 115]KAJ9659573.1 hypothetical protein H2201_007322 [Coniosporium apollinis]
MLVPVAHLKKTIQSEEEAGPIGSASWSTLLLSYANLAETTMGQPQVALLSQVEDCQIAWAFSYLRQRLAVKPYVRIDSLLSFAVIADLRLLLAEWRVIESVRGRSTYPLIHIAVLAPGGFLHANLSDRWYQDRSTAIEVLLDNGADIHQVFDNKSAFQTLFYKYSDPYSWGGGGWAPKLARPMEVFLKRHQDPGVRIHYGINGLNKWGAPLHAAAEAYDVHSVRCLLRYGAMVNSFDDDGYTPLDVASSQLRHGIRDKSIDPDIIAEHLNTIQILLDHGAKCSGKELREDPITTEELEKVKKVMTGSWTFQNLPVL